MADRQFPSSSASIFASTSAPTSLYADTNYYVYDVFINHRGPDCGKTVATYLYDRLSKHRLRVFLYQRELQAGDSLTSQIEGAIRTASVHIAIFSPRYVESSWCLNELVLMLESGKTIIPVFYGVRPSELRWTEGENGLCATLLRILCCIGDQTGVYARDLRKQQGKKTFDSQTGQQKPRYNSDTIGRWRNALFAVADISGPVLETCNGDTHQLVQQVVEAVLRVCKKVIRVSKNRISLDQKVEDFEQKMLLQQQSEQIGIVGLGGIGKTTLAKEIFISQHSKYDRSCFLFGVKDNSLKSLQGMLLKDLTEWTGQINSIDEGIEMLRRHLSSSKALIILDDVDHIEQMDALLLPVKDVLPSGSLIIVTSRNKDVLTSSGIVEASIYNLTGLDPQHAEELFCWHAFDHPHPVVGFEQVVNEFLNKCDGLPLLLKVLGAHMYGKNDLYYWEAQLLKISELTKNIQSVLKISYDSLHEEEKHIFLDTACFFIGKDRETALRIWNGSGAGGWRGVRNLRNKCLIEVDNEYRITMHDHIRDLGRVVAEYEPPGRLLRLWRPIHLSESHQSPIRGISMVPEHGSEWHPHPQSFKNLAQVTRRLQLLRAEGSCVESILNAAQSPELIWLCWNKCPYSSLPAWIRTENLRVLQIEGSELETLWSHESQAPVQLRELDIDACLLNIPKSIGKLKHLEKFVLYGRAYESFGLKTLPDEFCYLQSLQHLQLGGCSLVESLPVSIGNLTNLLYIDLSYWSNLHMLPNSFGNLKNLQFIYLSFCFHLQMLPDSFGELTNLRHIDLSNCSDLQMLPDFFHEFTQLEYINLSSCSKLQNGTNLHMLPDSLANLKNLRQINLSSCPNLQMLPDFFGNLTNLQNIDLSNCSNLQNAPPFLWQRNKNAPPFLNQLPNY